MEKNTKLMYKELYAVCLTAFIILSYVSFYFGNNVNKIYYYGFAISIPIGLIAYHFYSKFKYLNEVDELKKKWGKKIEKKRQMKLIKRLFDSVEKDDKDKFYIDDQTWNDLTMDEIYSIIDRTITTPGEEALYLLLRSPFIKIPKIIHRKELINKLQKDDDFREKIQSNLLIIGKQKGNTALPLIFGSSLPERPVYAFLYDIMALLAAASIISVAFLGIKAVPTFIMPVFFINLFIHYSTDQKINVDISSIKYLSKIIRVSKKMSKELKENGFGEYADIFEKIYLKCKDIDKKGGALSTGGGTIDPIREYIDVFFLAKVRNFYRAVGSIEKNKEDLKELYIKIGEIDALLSIASFRSGIDNYVEPEFIDDGAYININDAVNPLIENAVPNSISVNGDGIIITGANMSGKSTYLRTVGVNILLAQTICTCLSKAYKGSIFRIMTSISSADNIIGGKSYYLAEAEALLKIINASGESTPVFCMIDEIFRGTNSVERIAASAEILRYLVKHNAVVIVATHDLELVDLVGNEYKYYYFTENISETELKFDYKIREGVSKNKNAVKIMKYLGYPDEIIEKTNSRISVKID